MSDNKAEIDELRALVRRNEESVESLREMVEHLADLVSALEEKERQQNTRVPPGKKSPEGN